MPGLGLGLGLNKQKITSGGFQTSYVNNLVAKTALDGNQSASSPVLSALDTLMASLIANGIDVKMDALWVLATDGDREFAKYNVLNPGTYDCTEINTPTFTSLQGFKGSDGTSSGLNTNFAPATNGVQWNAAGNSASFGFYIHTLFTTGLGIMGTDVGENSKRNGGYAFINGVTVGTDVPEVGTNHLNFNSSGRQYFINGTQTLTSAVTTPGTESIKPFVIGGESTTTGFSDATIAVAWVGASLSAEAAALNSAITNYMSSI